LLLIDWLRGGSAFLSKTSAAMLRAPRNLRFFSPFDELTVRGINTIRATSGHGPIVTYLSGTLPAQHPDYRQFSYLTIIP
jgi:hypothetical protein